MYKNTTNLFSHMQHKSCLVSENDNFFYKYLSYSKTNCYISETIEYINQVDIRDTGILTAASRRSSHKAVFSTTTGEKEVGLNCQEN
jgi:hypothetical protein